MSGDQPTTRYVEVGDLQLAYQVIGDGPIDVVFHHGFCHLDLQWDIAAEAGFNRRLASFSRLILFDRRGTGASERLPRDTPPSLDDWTDDLLAVLDAAGSESAAIFVEAEAGPVGINFATRHPDRVSALVLANTAARFAAAPDYPDGWSDDRIEQTLELFRDVWGTSQIGEDWPTVAHDPHEREALGRLTRAAATPGMAIEHYRRVWTELDVRDRLGGVSVPTLVLSTEPFRELAAYLATHIPGAELVETASSTTLLMGDEFEDVLSEVAAFLTGTRLDRGARRRLLTTLFTDIVASTERLNEVGDRRWRAVLDTHDRTVRRVLERYGGREVNTTGDGFVAVFDTPSDAVRCAQALVRSLGAAGIEIRAGVHSGECELRGDDVAGMSVHLAARVAAAASPGEVLVSRTVADLLLGSDIEFVDRGAHDLKGVPERGRLLAVVGE